MVHSTSKSVSTPALWFKLKTEAPANQTDAFAIKSLLEKIEESLVNGGTELSKDSVNDFLWEQRNLLVSK
jgi:hypothetical protein